MITIAGRHLDVVTFGFHALVYLPFVILLLKGRDALEQHFSQS